MLYIHEITLRRKSGRGSLSRARRSYPEARIYIHPKNETILDNLTERHFRPYTLYRKEVIPELFRRLGLDLNKVKLSWSQKAGCTCPCSPGFIVKPITGDIPYDIFVTVSNKFTSRIAISGEL